jgi:hypothetical protein
VAALYETWNRAMRLYEAGKAKEALALLASLRKEAPEFFRDKDRAALLAEMEAATKPPPPKPAPEPAKVVPTLSPEARAALQKRYDTSAEIVARAASPEDRERLSRFLKRFVAPPPDGSFLARSGAWQDDLLSKVAADGRSVKDGKLPVEDAEEAEKRRLEELEKLRQRDVLTLLDSIAGGLAWLAIHQGDDGRVSDAAGQARCKKLHPEAPCPLPAGGDVDVASTALAALAFLDFRDQDARGLFEPTLARAVRWLLSAQRPDGSFAGRRQYSSAIALMALGQAAASSGAPEVVDAVRRGMTYFSLHQGSDGGWRYGLPIEVGDLSATAWVAQAFEAARSVSEPTPATQVGLDRFLHDVWLGGHRFSYLARNPERSSLNAAGMLVAEIVQAPEVPAARDEWKSYLVGQRGARPDLYSLYYGVRMTIRLTGDLPGPWRKWVLDLAAEQVVKGPAAGSFQKTQGQFKNAGTTGVTAATLLTLEHALYLR